MLYIQCTENIKPTPVIKSTTDTKHFNNRVLIDKQYTIQYEHDVLNLNTENNSPIKINLYSKHAIKCTISKNNIAQYIVYYYMNDAKTNPKSDIKCDITIDQLHTLPVLAIIKKVDTNEIAILHNVNVPLCISNAGFANNKFRVTINAESPCMGDLIVSQKTILYEGSLIVPILNTTNTPLICTRLITNNKITKLEFVLLIEYMQKDTCVYGILTPDEIQMPRGQLNIYNIYKKKPVQVCPIFLNDTECVFDLNSNTFIVGSNNKNNIDLHTEFVSRYC